MYGRLLASSLVLTAADGSSQTALALAAYTLGVVWEEGEEMKARPPRNSAQSSAAQFCAIV